MELDPETGETRPLPQVESEPVIDQEEEKNNDTNQNEIKQPVKQVEPTQPIEQIDQPVEQTEPIEPVEEKVEKVDEKVADIFVGEQTVERVQSDAESDREVEEILDKRLVEGKEPWYLIKWKNIDHSNNTWEPIDHLKCTELIDAFEEKIQNQDPEEEFEVEEVCGKKRIDGDLYYFVKWKGYPDASNTWEPEENIYAKDKIDEFEAKFASVTTATPPAPTDRSSRRRRPIKETVMLEDKDWDEAEEEIEEAPKPGRKKAVAKAPRATPKRRKRASGPTEEEIQDPNYDDFYDKLNVRVPPSTYDTSDFDKSHLFHIRMSNYLSWIILEHHIHYFDEIKPDPRQVRQEKLHKRLQFYHMKQEMVDLILSREVGVWEAILCMNAAQRRLEIEKMRRSLRDNESIPIPMEWNIMKFVAQIDKRRRKQFGFGDPVGATTTKGRGRRKGVLTPKKRKPPKKREPPKKRVKKPKVDDLKDFVVSDGGESSDEVLSEVEGDDQIEKEMEAELEKDQDDDVIKVPSENELDDDPELEALTKMAERHHEKMQQQQQMDTSNILAAAAAEAQIEQQKDVAVVEQESQKMVVPIEPETAPQETPPMQAVAPPPPQPTNQQPAPQQPTPFAHIMPNEQFNGENLKPKEQSVILTPSEAQKADYYNGQS